MTARNIEIILGGLVDAVFVCGTDFAVDFVSLAYVFRSRARHHMNHDHRWIGDAVIAGREPGERAAVVIGRLTAHLITLRQMSLSVAGMLQAGQNPNLEAAVVKDVGTGFEQEIPETVHALMGAEPRLHTGSPFERTLGFLMEHAPSFSLRGGTREVLRGIIARGLGLR